MRADGAAEWREVETSSRRGCRVVADVPTQLLAL